MKHLSGMQIDAPEAIQRLTRRFSFLNLSWVWTREERTDCDRMR